MPIELEDLEYQRQAVATVVGLFEGQTRNSFDNANFFGIQTNLVQLAPEVMEANKKVVLAANGLNEADAVLSPEPDVCIEMETGTGKTLVYLRTIFELYQQYGFTKFIILVPSIAIREGVLSTFDAFKTQLEDRYGFVPEFFEYDSSKLFRLKHFIEDSRPQVMVMTMQSMTAEDRIINQTGRDDSFDGKSYLEALGQCRPILIMDEPQEGMDTETAVARLASLQPRLKLRYSATHKVLRNLLYRLTPFAAYQQGLVKKIEVLSVAERNDEATLKIELVSVQTKGGSQPKAKLRLWWKNGDAFKLKESPWLSAGNNLADKSGNISYREYSIERIYKSLRDSKFHVKFSNGVELVEQERSADLPGIFRQQLQWLIRRHFQKKPVLAARGIKCLSLVFIDRVDSYIRDDGIIRRLFAEEYASVYREFHATIPTPEQITAAQGYYFAKTGGGEYTDSENAMLKNRAVFDLILKEKEELLRAENPVEFIFSHSALGVGWDNPNVFNIATLNQSFNDIKKRQEIGRGLRICRSSSGHRVYDDPQTPEGEELNLLTVVPNETYETFALQYQDQIKEVYGSAAAGANLRQKHKGKPRTHKVRRTKLSETASFKAFWARLARKTDYTVAFHEGQVVERAIEALNAIQIGQYEAEVVLTRIRSIALSGMESTELGRDVGKLKSAFSPLDLIEEISENTALSYPTVCQIVTGLRDFDRIARNPPQFLAAACAQIRRIELDEMIRSLSYHPTSQSLPLVDLLEVIETYLPVQATPHRGVYDNVICESDPERAFAIAADNDNEVVCFLKLPDFYKIPTPIGDYSPDFGLVLRRRNLRSGEENEYYFVIETKSTNDLDDARALNNSERVKIRCAMKHFEALGIEAKLSYAAYHAPVKDYHSDFKAKVPQP